MNDIYYTFFQGTYIFGRYSLLLFYSQGPDIDEHRVIGERENN